MWLVFNLLTTLGPNFETPPTSVGGISRRLKCSCVGRVLNSPPTSAGSIKIGKDHGNFLHLLQRQPVRFRIRGPAPYK